MKQPASRFSKWIEITDGPNRVQRRSVLVHRDSSTTAQRTTKKQNRETARVNRLKQGSNLAEGLET